MAQLVQKAKLLMVPTNNNLPQFIIQPKAQPLAAAAAGAAKRGGGRAAAGRSMFTHPPGYRGVEAVTAAAEAARKPMS
jgi:hypothetical protein